MSSYNTGGANEQHPVDYAIQQSAAPSTYTLHESRGQRPYQCDVLGCHAGVQSWTREDKLEMHYKQWHGSFPCPENGCDYSYPNGLATQTDLDKHRAKIHSIGALDQTSSYYDNYATASVSNITQTLASTSLDESQPPVFSQSAVTRSSNPTTTGEIFDPDYRIHSEKEFKWGKVLKLLWVEPAGLSSGEGSTEPDFSVALAYEKVRRFVIIGQRKGHCLCLPINTYSGQGVSKRGVHAEDHAIIYSEKPVRLEGELEKGLTKAPIRVIPMSNRHRLDKASRLNYAKVYTIESNLRVCFIGKIHPGSENRFVEDYNAAHPPLKAPGSYLPASSANTPIHESVRSSDYSTGTRDTPDALHSQDSGVASEPMANFYDARTSADDHNKRITVASGIAESGVSSSYYPVAYDNFHLTAAGPHPSLVPGISYAQGGPNNQHQDRESTFTGQIESSHSRKAESASLDQQSKWTEWTWEPTFAQFYRGRQRSNGAVVYEWSGAARNWSSYASSANTTKPQTYANLPSNYSQKQSTNALPPTARNIVNPTEGDTNQYDPVFEIHNSSSFIIGRVFKIAWRELELWEPFEPNQTAFTPKTTGPAKYAPKTNTRLRRFIIIATGHGHSSCVEIVSYDPQYINDKRASHKDYAIVYTTDRPPKNPNSFGFNNKPVQIQTFSPHEILPPESVVNYIKIHNIEHSVKAYFIGRLTAGSEKEFFHSVNAVWNRNTSASALY